ncbi:MAG: hypothetical protein LBE12_08395 [Planctomycetaceae bacterium]|nr:hypothetical protein [Planctomycetaceae bacterium]
MRNDYRFGSNPLAALSTLNFPLSTIILPFQGGLMRTIPTRRVVAGWLMLPFQGYYGCYL